MIQNVIAVAAIVLVIGFAVFYVYRSKKNGKRCIGCPGGGACDSCGCTCDTRKSGTEPKDK